MTTKGENTSNYQCVEHTNKYNSMKTPKYSTHFLHIYAKPKSHQNKIERWVQEGEQYILHIRIIAPPEGGKANKAIIALLAKTLDITKSNITLISGATSRYKIFKITAWPNLLAEKLPKQAHLLTLF